jgi:MFS family permease
MNSLTTMYLCELVPMSRFGNATGIVNLFRGFGCFLGPFLAGLVAKYSNDQAVFYFSSAFFAVGLLFTFLCSFLQCFKCCRPNDDATEDAVAVKSADESELNKNLLHANA